MATEISQDNEMIFKQFDTNGDGKISLQELSNAMRKLRSTSLDEVFKTMTEIDADGDGSIDKTEFEAFCKAHPDLVKDIAKVF
ncbi:hypothetical protein LUZ61_018295 [Rhynchospora tenuis]|uniref:EF-hand domain-containing protein n=1 Tax=Rhynchospora tenuis TaxID=198213 RepID=A0AAD6ELV0_9POAL|nr:hypothetical protein LUZ61_018295 [Rhynchospora tenuis]